MYTHQQTSPTTYIAAPCIDPKELCPSCPTVLPSDICFNCGKLSKFLVAYPEHEANQESTGLTNSCYVNTNKRYTRLQRERKLEYRANKLRVEKTFAMNWQFNLDGGLRDEKLRDGSELPVQDVTDPQEYSGIQIEDIHVYYDIWEDPAQDDIWDDLSQDESTLLDDDDLNLHYLGHNLMASLDMAAAENYFDPDDEDSEYGDADDSFAPNSFIIKMAQRCGTLQWEASLPVERISRKAQGLYNHLCGWNFADAMTARVVLGATLVEDDDEILPLDSAEKFSFEGEEKEELDRGFWESWDGDEDGDGVRYCSDSSEATVRDRVVECRRVVGGLAYEWDILL